MAPTEALPLTISNPYVPYKAPDKASAFALRYVLLVVPVMLGSNPNITGTFLSGSNGSNDWDSGAFLETRETTYISRNGPNQNHSKCSFKADRVTSIYGAATTVQSSALQTLIIIRI